MSSESLKSLLGNGEKNEAECDENDVKTSSFETFFNIFNTNMGTGILAIPYVIKLTGYWGVFLVILIAFLGNYTGKLLIYCLKYTPSTDGKPLTSYADLGNVFLAELWLVSGACNELLRTVFSLHVVLDHVWHRSSSYVSQQRYLGECVDFYHISIRSALRIPA